MRPKLLLVFALALSFFVLPGTPPRVDAQQQVTFRIATLAPSGTPIVRGFQKWDKILRKDTQGKVSLRIYPGGSAGDEKVMIRKMRVGQLDGAAVTTTGLGLVVRPSLVLSAPGVIMDYKELDLVRHVMKDEFNKMFEDAGYVLLGWGDSGLLRTFSQKNILAPSDLRSARPWVWPDNPVMVEMLRVTGANGVPLGVPEVYPGLQTGMIDTVFGSALTTVALQWFTRVKYMSSETGGVLIGALIVRKDKFEALPKDVQELIRKSAVTGETEMQKQRAMDDQAYKALLQHGIKVSNTNGHRKEWEKVFRTTTNHLVGRLYSQKLLDHVMSIVARVRTDYPTR